MSWEIYSEPSWEVVEEAEGRYSNAVVLKATDGDDDMRVVVYLAHSGPLIEENDYVQRIYPCSACGWRRACGKGCHS